MSDNVSKGIYNNSGVDLEPNDCFACGFEVSGTKLFSQYKIAINVISIFILMQEKELLLWQTEPVLKKFSTMLLQ